MVYENLKYLIGSCNGLKILKIMINAKRMSASNGLKAANILNLKVQVSKIMSSLPSQITECKKGYQYCGNQMLNYEILSSSGSQVKALPLTSSRRLSH